MSGLKIGDVVVLNSGGPKMTIGKIGTFNSAQSAWVSWFDNKDKPQKGVYPLTSIKLHSAPKPVTGRTLRR